ncbi:MAG: hypothetical protein ACYCVY_06325 [Acidiferrobacteraceae bacterium]
MAWLIVATLFLPLFPLSIVFNTLLGRLRHPVARSAFILLWPQIGVAAVHIGGNAAPQAFLPWALGSAGLYALRLLTVSDLGTYAGFLACSSLALTWSPVTGGATLADVGLFVVWFSLPAALLAGLTGPLTRRFGAAYAKLCSGLGQSMPRLSVALALTVLSAIATAPSPAFFALWSLLRGLDAAGVVAVLGVWLIWGWGAARFLQGFVFGTPREVGVSDIGRGAASVLWVALAVFTVSGIYLAGGRL